MSRTENYYEEVRRNYNVTQCTKCPGVKGICHKNCAYGSGEDKKNCCAMGDDGNCRKCGCNWTVHVNSDIEYVAATR